MDLLLIGVVTKAHGLKGEVVVEPHNAGSPLWKKPGLLVHAVTRDIADKATDRVNVTPARSFVLRASRPQLSGGETRYLCTFDGVVDRDGAEAIRSLHLAVDPDLVPPPADDEFYHSELRGFAVRDAAGTALGTVVGVLPGPAQDLLEIQPPAAKAATYYVPFVEPIIGVVDRIRRVVTIDRPEGLVP